MAQALPNGPVGRPPRRQRRGRRLRPRWQRTLGWSLLAVALLLLAWLGCNLVDNRPRPVPPALDWSGTPADSMMALRLTGALVPADQDPVYQARLRWRAAFDGRPAEAYAASDRAGTWLTGLDGPPLRCGRSEGCLLHWQRLPDEALASGLQAQLQAQAVLGQRCTQALADGPFDEPVPALPRPDSALALHARGAVQCGLWFNGQALLAAARGDQTEALLALVAGERLSQSLLSGSHSLLGHAVAWSVAQRQHELVAAVLLRHPDWAAALQPLAAPWPAEWLQPQRWAPVEAAMARGLMDRLRSECGRPVAGVETGWIDTLACRTGLGQLPRATQQALDARWLALLQGPPGDARPAVERLAGSLPAADEDAAWDAPIHWRNPLGQALVAAGEPGVAAQVARQADVGLQRQLLALAIAATPLPPAERAAWLQRQPLPAALRGQITLADGGRLLQATAWAQRLVGDRPRPTDGTDRIDRPAEVEPGLRWPLPAP